MGRILTVIWKELLLLSRDHAGLLSLFLLPAALVLVITLVQQNVMELTGERAGSMIFIDHEQEELGPELQALLREHRGIELVTWPVERAEEARIAVVSGEYSGLLILPEGVSDDLRLRLERLAAADQEEADDRTVNQQKSAGSPLELQLFFDPALLPGFRQEISTMVRLAMARVELEWKLELLVDTIRDRLEELGIPGEFLRQETFGIETLSEELLRLREWTEGQEERRQPGVVQQNVPAWALFGMFFTVLPLGGGLLWERRSGVWLRLRSMPLAVASLLGGKMLAYLLVGLCQFALIYLIGNRVFPLLGLPAFSLAGLFWEVGLVVLVVSLAACGYGLMLGSACSSYEQVAMFGSISIVLAAALGGIMVPVYAMPAFMQQLAVVSPLNWGLTAFHEILVRGNGLAGAGIWLFWLLLFALGNLLLAWRLTAK